MKYTTLYRNQQELIKSSPTGRKALKALFGNKPVSFQKYAHTMKDIFNNGSEKGKNSTKLLNEELQWHKGGAPVVFLETQELVRYLYEAKFNYEKDFNVAPPFQSFVMAFPEHTEINGVALKSALITIMTRDEFINLYGPSVTTLLDFFNTDYDDDELCISVNYTTSSGRVDTNFSHLSSLTTTFKRNAINPLPNNGTNMLEALTKIALALCVYHSATDGKKLEKGYPSSAISLPKSKSKGSYKAVTIRSFKEKQSSDGDSTRKITHRIPHYRNLRAERFYKKDKYKNMKRGTRWTFVKEVDVYGSLNTLLS
ncbi:hypothetical protein E2R68_12150 [Psychromonas sp. RZ22]|uniref:hypothetical protein n=1 Tax=Psychromonas algarum TaxID=2555643 RepID=UPI001067C466|nr:hypothetical protein [Psychromonas sp. RZ22]TEW53564.1 hypothetical protein E2R68_12150 [Psychromonas sp. RZ22]